jgi:hypothetical protein
MRLEMNLPCPSCGFETVADGVYGTYVICEICNWEDDQMQLANPFSSGGANSLSLYESQIRTLKKFPIDVKEVDGFSRNARWQPLNEMDKQKFTTGVDENCWVNKGTIDEHETYWVQNS